MDGRAAKKRKLRTHIIDVWTSRLRRCLAPGNNCSSGAIAAHSIQRSGPLALLAAHGHVCVLRGPIGPQKPPAAVFKRIGVRQASVFTGLCAKHDSELFAPIERQPFDPENRLHFRLHAYRAILQETHASMETAARLQSTYQQELALGLSDSDDPSPFGIFTTQRLIACYATWLYKEQCDGAFGEAPLLDFEHDVLQLPGTGPRIAVSALFSLDHLRVQDDIARAAITVFPTVEGDTFVIISYLPKDQAIVRADLTNVLHSRGVAQRYLLSRLLLENCQNIAFAPALVDAMSIEQREIILDFFNRTVLRNDPDFQSPHLNLFDEVA